MARSAAFYEAVFGWSVDPVQGSFEAPDMIGQWTTERPPAPGGGPVLWIHADDLGPTLQAVERHGGTVAGRPQLDSGERWLTEIDDPAGNRVGVVVAAGAPQPQTLLAVADVEASSRWYQHLLGLRSGHGGPHYERLLADGTLVLQLHHRETEHDHGRIGDPDVPPGNGVLVWFGEVADFDGVLERAAALGAPVVHGRAPEPAGRRGQRARPPRGVDHRPRRLHGRRRQPRRRGVRAPLTTTDMAPRAAGQTQPEAVAGSRSREANSMPL